MTWDSWSCLMVQNGPGLVPENICAALKKAACELHLKSRDRMPLVGELDGVIETHWSSHFVGTRSGILFRSQFDWEGGGCKINFLLSTEDLKRGAETLREMIEQEGGKWIESPEPFPVPELFKFYDLRSTRALH